MKIEKLLDLENVISRNYTLTFFEDGKYMSIKDLAGHTHLTVVTRSVTSNQLAQILKVFNFNFNYEEPVELTVTDTLRLKVMQLDGVKTIELQEGRINCRHAKEMYSQPNKFSFLEYGKTYNIDELVGGTMIKNIETIIEFSNKGILEGSGVYSLDFNGIQKIFIKNGDSVGVVSFWIHEPATKCINIIRDDVKAEFLKELERTGL